MPARDGTGPGRMGPGTGRGLGNCKASQVTAKQNGTAVTIRPLRRNRVYLGSWLGGFFRRWRKNRLNQN